MTNITSPKDYTVTGSFDIDCSFKRDADSTRSKHVTLRFKCTSVPLLDVITASLAPKRIAWQNNIGRKNFDTIKDRSVVEVDFTSPAKRVKTREERIAEFVAQGFTVEVATFAVDNPEQFAQVVNATMTKPDEDELPNETA